MICRGTNYPRDSEVTVPARGGATSAFDCFPAFMMTLPPDERSLVAADRPLMCRKQCNAKTPLTTAGSCQ